MKRIFTSAIFILCASVVHAQFVYDYVKAADNYFQKKDYASAASYYEKYLGTGTEKMKKEGYNPYTVQTNSKKSASGGSTEQAVYNLAESYRLLNYPSKAEPYYTQATGFDKSRFPLAQYHLATTLRALEKFEEAEKNFEAFLAGYPQTDQYTEAAKREIANLKFIREQLARKDLSLYTVSKSGSELNPDGANYAPVWLNGNTILFTSTRPDNSADKNNVHANRIYQASYAGGAATDIRLLSLPQEKGIQQGAASVSPDGNTLFVTRWSVADGKKNASIYVSRRSSDGWSAPASLDNQINVAGYNAQQPHIMPDGKTLLFASDRPGGVGGLDIWKATIDGSGTISAVVNAGNAVNTAFDEQAPYFHESSQTLIFSSNGRTGMGGFDFFQSKETAGSWSQPINLGYPVNSVKDDIYFVSRGIGKNILEDVLLNSDRSAACCLELFSLRKQKVMKQVSGLIVNCETMQPVPGAVVKAYDPGKNSNVFTGTVTADGSYLFTLEEFQPLNLEAMAEGYEKAEIKFFSPADEDASSLVNPTLCLVKIKAPEVGTIEVMENVYYQFNKYKLEPESYVELDKIVKMLKDNPTMVIEISGHTDSKGSDDYNQRLSQLRAEACVEYIVSQGIDRNRVIPKGYGEKLPVTPNTNADGTDNPEGREKNRRTEFKVLKK